MPRVIVADTSCLILFYKIGELDLLQKVFGQITITQIVADEFKRPIPDWILIQEPSPDLQKGLIGFLDLGEASSIALALEFTSSLLIIDELKGRKVASELGLVITGSLGILITAKNKGLIKKVKPILEKIKHTNFRISENLIQKLLNQVNEA